MRTRITERALPMCRSAALALMLASVVGCAANVARIKSIATPVTSLATSGRPEFAGPVTTELPDGRDFEGWWNTISDSHPADAAAVETPDGRISAADLDAPYSPFATATLEGNNSRMACVLAGDFGRGSTSRCVDSSGARWEGPFYGYSDEIAGIYVRGGLVLKLSRIR